MRRTLRGERKRVRAKTHHEQVIDSFDNAFPEAVSRVREITNCAKSDLVVVECDLVDLNKTIKAVGKHAPYKGCIHFAGFKAVGESVQIPMHYYYNNLVGTMHLIRALDLAGCHSLIFSSSSTVYGLTTTMPLLETMPLPGATNPYGSTKFMLEQVLTDIGKSDAKWKITCLRYFNPVGAHPSGRIGEDPKGVPQNLVPFVAQVAIGRRDKVSVFGNDYDTPDGTGVRDYIHVMDVARGHAVALSHMKSGTHMYNLGTGKGSTVLEVIAAFTKAAAKDIPFVIAPRRTGDVAWSYCDPSKALAEMGFKCEHTLEDACRDFWRWQTLNPNGYLAEGESADDVPRKAVVFKLFPKVEAASADE